jgi:hypothetical protein
MTPLHTMDSDALSVYWVKFLTRRHYFGHGIKANALS